MRWIVAGVGAKFNSDEFWRWSSQPSIPRPLTVDLDLGGDEVTKIT
jgi:hypothetical protein